MEQNFLYYQETQFKPCETPFIAIKKVEKEKAKKDNHFKFTKLFESESEAIEDMTNYSKPFMLSDGTWFCAFGENFQKYKVGQQTKYGIITFVHWYFYYPYANVKSNFPVRVVYFQLGINGSEKENFLYDTRNNKDFE